MPWLGALRSGNFQQGRKKYTPPPWKPSFFSFWGLRLYGVYGIPFFPDLWCIPFSLVFPGKWYTPWVFLLCDLGVGRQTEKGGVPRWWCILFFPVQGSLGNFGLLLSSSERTSGEVAEKLPGKFGELPGKSGDFPEARGSLTPSQRLAKFVSQKMTLENYTWTRLGWANTRVLKTDTRVLKRAF